MVLIVVLKKMIKNRWLTFCLLLGLLIAIALISSIPVYSSGVLQRVLIKEMEQYQLDSGSFPGACTLSLYFDSDSNPKDRYSTFMKIQGYAKKELPDILGIPYHLLIEDLETDMCTVMPEDPSKVDPSSNRTAKLKAVSDFENHIQLTNGKMPSSQKVDGIYEVLVTEGALKELDMVLDTVFIVRVIVGDEERHVRVKPVGTFIPKHTDNYFWTKSSILYDKRFYMDKDLFMKNFVTEKGGLLKGCEWYYALNYHKIMVHDINRLLNTYDDISRYLLGMPDRVKLSIPVMDSLEKYRIKEMQIKLLLLSLNVPIILMLCFYLFMLSSLIVEADQNEIALYKSRGASRWHIIVQYFAQGIILGGVAVLVGPCLGLLCTKMLGAPRGFMEFAERTALPLTLNKEAYLYTLLAVLGFWVMLLIPASRASLISIIDHKRQISRYKGVQLWKKFYLDIGLLVIATYGIYTFRQHKQILQITGVNAVDLKVSPLLFIASTFFVLGTGLVFMRIYPWILKGVYFLCRRWLTVPLYATLLRVCRTFHRYQFIVIFLMMTLATGLFSANVARTLNNNMDDRIRYHIGCDITVMPLWQYQTINPQTGSVMYGVELGQKEGITGMADSQIPLQIQFVEPPYESFANLPGVAHTAKVFKREQINVQGLDFGTDNVCFMAINPYDFGKVAWFRSDLLAPYHINAYLNLMTLEPTAILISKSMSEYYKIRVGDTLHIGWPGVNGEKFTVYGIIQYWPSWNPARRGEMSSSGLEGSLTGSMFIVANLSFVQDYLALEPYEIWMKCKPDATSEDLYKGIEDKGLMVTHIEDARQEVFKARRSPGYIAINGAATLGFITSLIITFLGFLIYWVLAIHKQVFEFGVLRAMGASLFKLICMIVWEQLLVSIVAAISGIMLGGLTSNLFVPFFSVAYSADVQVPPFKVFSEYSDHLKLYASLAVMLIIVFCILTWVLIKIKINQAIKLGEE